MSTFGILLKAYWELAQRLQCDSDEPFEEDYPALRDSLADLFRALPSGTGILTLSELDFVIHEVSNALEPLFEEPSEIESEFRRLLERSRYSFRVPIARLRQFAVNDFEIGGRLELGLDTDESNGKVLCVLKGVAIGSHWSVVRRVVTETADEVLGTLTAVGIAEFLPASHAMGGAPVPRLTVALESDSVDAPEIKWSDKFALSWQQNHDVWSTVLRRPFDLTEIELAEERRAGMGGPIQRRFESAARPFRYGGMDAKRVRCSARFLRKAVTAESPGDSYLFLATCLEGLLVAGKGDLAVRVADAVAFLLGQTHAERSRFRELAEHLYDVRSRYVHEGAYTGDERFFQCLELAARVLAAELRALEERAT